MTGLGFEIWQDLKKNMMKQLLTILEDSMLCAKKFVGKSLVMKKVKFI